MRAKLNWLSALLVCTTVTLAEARQAGRIFRIGYLDPSTASSTAGLLEAFRQELNKRGWTEGKNIVIEYRFAESKPERQEFLANELVRWKPDVIVAAGGSPSVARKVTATVPIIVASGVDLVAGLRIPANVLVRADRVIK